MKQVKHPVYGAVICFSDNNGGAGHVAIVEEIQANGTIRCSNSAWRSTFFWVSTITPNAQGRYNWSHYTHQGFIYNPYSDEPTPPEPPFPPINLFDNNWAWKSKKVRIYK